MDAFTALLWLTLNIYHEGRGEDQYAQIAIAHATMNRSKERGKTIKATVLQPYQFSWTITKKSEAIKDPAAFLKCYQSAVIAMNGHDFTGGATFYHEKKIKPSWLKDVIYITDIGSHKFYRRK